MRRSAAPLRVLRPDDFEEDEEFEIYAEVRQDYSDDLKIPFEYHSQLIELAVQAFARAIQLLPSPPSDGDWHDLVQACLALDGFRCGLLLLDALDDIEPVLDETVSCCDDWLDSGGPTTFSDQFEWRVRQTSAWLRGLHGDRFWEPGNTQASGDEPRLNEELLRVIRWQGRETLEVLRELPKELLAALARAPAHEFAEIDRELARTFGN
jgi:hypothetical protein